MANESYSIDFDFVESSEGGSQLEAYVPMCSEKSVKNKNNKICFGQEKEKLQREGVIDIIKNKAILQLNSKNMKLDDDKLKILMII